MCFIRYGLTLILSLTITACVSRIPLEKQIADTDYTPPGHILISVSDNRPRVLESLETNRDREQASRSEYDEIMTEEPVRDHRFIGVAHGAYGIPMNLATAYLVPNKADKNKTLAQLLSDRIIKGLRKHGWSVDEAELRTPDDTTEALQLMKQHDADKLIALNIREWYISINLNWISAFNFDTNTDIRVFDVQAGEVLKTNIRERDVIEEKYDDAYENLILEAYKSQLDQIFNDPELKKALFDTDQP